VRCEQALALEVRRISRNDQAREELLSLGVSMKLLPWVDENGQPVADGHVLMVKDAEGANLEEAKSEKVGVVFIKTTSALKRIEAITEQLKKPQRR
jgi:hypothetical protein